MFLNLKKNKNENDIFVFFFYVCIHYKYINIMYYLKVTYFNKMYKQVWLKYFTI